MKNKELVIFLELFDIIFYDIKATRRSQAILKFSSRSYSSCILNGIGNELKIHTNTPWVSYILQLVVLCIEPYFGAVIFRIIEYYMKYNIFHLHKESNGVKC